MDLMASTVMSEGIGTRRDGSGADVDKACPVSTHSLFSLRYDHKRDLYSLPRSYTFTPLR